MNRVPIALRLAGSEARAPHALLDDTSQDATSIIDRYKENKIVKIGKSTHGAVDKPKERQVCW